MTKPFNIDALVRTRVARIEAYSSARDEFSSTGSQYTFLDANESPFNNGLNRYPDPNQAELKALLSTLRNIPPENILLGNGSDEVLDLIFRAFCEPGVDNIITVPPTYGMYRVLADLNGAENRKVSLTKDFQPDVKRILRQVDKQTKILFLCSPNNPTGNALATDSIGELLRHFSGLVVIDEAYIDFSTQESWISRLGEFPNLVVTQTFSKAYGLAGIRLGACYGSEEIIQILGRIKPPYNINALTQQCAAERLAHNERVEKEIQEVLRQRAYLRRHLNQLNLVQQVFPSDANFLLVRVDDAQKRYIQLQERNIITRNRSNETGCENTLRITVGTAAENLKLLETLKELDL